MKTFSDYGIDVGNRRGIEVKTTCPQCSSSRKKSRYPCLSVNTEKGVWHCFHCGWSGGLAKGIEHRPQITKTYRKPDYVAKTSGLHDTVVAWFAERGITEEVLRRNQIGVSKMYFPQVEEERPCVSYPYLRGSDVVNVKYRTRDKLFRMESGCERVLYGLNDIAEMVVFVEGEMDKLSLEVAGITSCVSVPDGAPTPDTKHYESKFDFMAAPELERARIHVIAVDNDAPGIRLREELVRRLGPENCLVVHWPDGCKDANDVLIAYGATVLTDCIRDAQPLPIVGAHDVSEYADELKQLYEFGSPRGTSTGWTSVDECYTVRSGDLTVVTGIPNSGKSEWIDALLVNLARNTGWSFGVFSPENHPVPEHIKKIAEKYAGKPFEPGFNERMTPSEWDMAQSWINQGFTFIDTEEPSLDAILDIARQLVRRKGIRGLVIDPWNEVEHACPDNMSETSYISQCLSKVRRFARNHGVHVWIVAHPTKLFKDKDGNYPVPSPYDISGSANWRNKADNCITVWRDLDPETRDAPVEIHIQKVRHKVVGKIGMAKLRYDRIAGRYFEMPDVINAYARRYEGG